MLANRLTRVPAMDAAVSAADGERGGRLADVRRRKCTAASRPRPLTRAVGPSRVLRHVGHV